MTPETPPEEVLEVKHENDQYKIRYKAELQLHIQNGRDITDTIEKQGPFNFKSHTPKLKICITIVTPETPPEEVLEVKHENDQYKIKYKGELQLHLK